MSPRAQLIVGIAVIAAASLWLLRGVVFLLTGPDAGVAPLLGLVVGGLALTAGIVTVRRGLARRVPS